MFVGNLVYYLHIYNIVYIFTIQFTVHNAVYRVAATSSGIFAHCRILQVAWQRERYHSSSLAKTDLDLSIVETPTLIIHIKILYVTLIIIT